MSAWKTENDGVWLYASAFFIFLYSFFFSSIKWAKRNIQMQLCTVREQKHVCNCIVCPRFTQDAAGEELRGAAVLFCDGVWAGGHPAVRSARQFSSSGCELQNGGQDQPAEVDAPFSAGNASLGFEEHHRKPCVWSGTLWALEGDTWPNEHQQNAV